jgi:GATA-binding protein
MSAAHYEERGGSMRARPTFADELDVVTIGVPTDSHALHSSSPQHVRFRPGHHDNTSGSSSTVQSLTSSSTLDSKLELSPREGAVRRGVLQESYFPTWKDDAGGVLESPEEMQKKDPLATQVWKLYSKARSQLPNAERMENLTWRMMSMNLRRLELERNKGLVLPPGRIFICL